MRISEEAKALTRQINESTGLEISVNEYIQAALDAEWNRAVENIAGQIDIIAQDWQAAGAEDKVYACEYLERTVRAMRRGG